MRGAQALLDGIPLDSQPTKQSWEFQETLLLVVKVEMVAESPHFNRDCLRRSYYFRKSPL